MISRIRLKDIDALINNIKASKPGISDKLTYSLTNSFGSSGISRGLIFFVPAINEYLKTNQAYYYYLGVLNG